MLERDALRKLIEAAQASVAHEEAASAKYRKLTEAAQAHADKHRAEAGALTQLLELWYPDEKPEMPF